MPFVKQEEIQELYRLSVEQNEDRGLRAMIRKIAVLCIALEVFSLKEFKERMQWQKMVSWCKS